MPIASSLTDGSPFFYRIGAREAQPRWAVVCLIQKAGSTLWKAALLRGLALHGFDVNGTEHMPSLDAVSFGLVHNQPLPYATPSVYADSTPCVMLVRHPLSRLLSAYLGKVRTGRAGSLGFARNASFREFAHTVMGTPARRLNPHILPQIHQCDVRSWQYTYLRVEEMGHWYRKLVCLLGLQSAVSSSFVHRSEALLALRQMTHPSETDGRRLRETMTMELRNYGEPGERLTSGSCFVRTVDCGCELLCGGSRCNGSEAGTSAQSAHHSFNSASEQLEEFYDESLARRVNEWAAADLQEFGYEPWMPSAKVRKPRADERG